MRMGNNLRKLRLVNNLTLQQVSEMLGVSVNTAYRWEANTVVPRNKQVEKLAKLYKVDMDYLMSDNLAFTCKKYLENEMMKTFNKLSDYDKNHIIKYAQRRGERNAPIDIL